MKNVILGEPSTLALLGLGLFMLILVGLVVLGAVVISIVFLTRKAKREASPAPPIVPSTQVIPKKCPKCGVPMPLDSPEGLCPRCLIALNLATQTDIPGEPGAAKAPPPPPAAVADVAKLFPQLEILECLGRGGMGAVYKVRQPRLDRIVALKILSPEKQGNQKFGERFEREARALAKLHHPNIVTVFDFGEVQGNFYLLMEFVDGLTLRQLLQARKLSPPEALAIVPKICEALQYAHEQGIVHRDIKPENILMDKEGHVKIADFGIAKILGDGDNSNLTAEQVIGTPHYMSPEQIEKPQSVDHRADIYSLGVVFYEMLTGELPLGKFQPPSKKVQVDVRLDEIVLRALEKEPERRYQQASEVKTQVETIAATPPPPPSEGSTAGNKPAIIPVAVAFRRGAWVALSIFLLITLATAGVTALMQRTYLATAEVMLEPASAPQHPPHSSGGAATPDFSPQLPENFRVPNELQVIQSSKVLEPVALSLNLPTRWGAKWGRSLDIDQTVDLIKARLHIDAVRNNTAILDINFYSDSPREAAEIANKIAEIYCALPSDLQKEIISRATQQSHPVRPNARLNIFLGAVIGMVLGIPAGLIVGLISFFSLRKKVRLQFQLQVQKPDHFWRWFAVVVLALISIPFLISILGLLAAIAIPNFVKARARAQAIRQQSLAMQQQMPYFNAQFHFRAFEADAGSVDHLIPSNRRQSADSTNASNESFSNQTSLGNFTFTSHGAAMTDSQVAEIDSTTLAALLKGLAAKPGLLMDQTGMVSSVWWYPGEAALAQSYNYDSGGFFGMGQISGFLGIRHTNGVFQIRIDGTLDQNLHPRQDFRLDESLRAQIFYEGDSPKTGILAFLVPFVRDGPHYLVIISEVKELPDLPERTFYVGQTWFPQGDSIEVTSVERTEDQMTVRGHYNLVSHDHASLALYITSTNSSGFHEDAEQTMQIYQGNGDFELTHSHLVPGLTHVSMYADGHSFASVYFGTKEEAAEESQAKWITDTPPASAETAPPRRSPLEKEEAKQICLSKLRIITAAKQEWALENNKTNGDVPTVADLQSYIQGGFPVCPDGGTYNINPVGVPPTCYIFGNVLSLIVPSQAGPP